MWCFSAKARVPDRAVPERSRAARLNTQTSSVEIDESVMTEGLPAQVVSDAVLLAMREAHNASLELTRSSLAEFYSGMGVPMPGQAGGPAGMPAAPAPAAAQQKPKEEMGFDPAGLGKIGFLD